MMQLMTQTALLAGRAFQSPPPQTTAAEGQQNSKSQAFAGGKTAGPKDGKTSRMSLQPGDTLIGAGFWNDDEVGNDLLYVAVKPGL